MGKTIFLIVQCALDFARPLLTTCLWSLFDMDIQGPPMKIHVIDVNRLVFFP